MTLNEYTFDVAVSTHDHLKDAVLVHHWTRVSVYAPEGYLTASLIALEVAACGGWMPTDIMYVE